MCRRTAATHATSGIGIGRSLGIVTMAATVTVMTDRSTHRRSRAPIGGGSIAGPTHRSGSTAGPAMAGPTAAISGVLTTAVIATTEVTEVTEVSEAVGMTGVVTASPHQPRPRRRPRYPPRRRASSQAARRRSSGRRTRCLWCPRP